MRLGIFGAGFSGFEIGKKAIANGASVWGTSRSPDRLAKLADAGFDAVEFDGEVANAPVLDALTQTSHLVVSIAPPRAADNERPDAMVDPVLAALGDKPLAEIAPNLQWVGYLSTVGVYGNHDGRWIDEDVPVGAVSERSKQRVRAEAEWLAVDEAHHLPVGLFRLSGIYGPGRNALKSAEQGKARRLIKRDQVFNRIHVGDIAEALWRAATIKAAGIFNITDDLPAPPQDVVTLAHELMGKTPPPEMDFETADLSPMARSFYGENKRVANGKSKQALKLVYQWPTYEIALKKMWAEEAWR